MSRTGRNEPCPCGSGKKYKKCCGGSSASNGATKANSPMPAYLNPSLIAQQWMASQQAPQEQSKIKLILDHYISSSEEANDAIRAMGKIDDEGVVLFYRKKQWFGEAVLTHEGAIVVTTAKKADADELKTRLEAISGVTHISRKEDKFEGLETTGNVDVGKEMKTFKVRFFKAWMDESNERLEGSTPRQATKVPALKAKLRNLVKELEEREAKLPKKERYSFKGIKKELGL